MFQLSWSGLRSTKTKVKNIFLNRRNFRMQMVFVQPVSFTLLLRNFHELSRNALDIRELCCHIRSFRVRYLDSRKTPQNITMNVKPRNLQVFLEGVTELHLTILQSRISLSTINYLAAFCETTEPCIFITYSFRIIVLEYNNL